MKYADYVLEILKMALDWLLYPIMHWGINVDFGGAVGVAGIDMMGIFIGFFVLGAGWGLLKWLVNGHLDLNIFGNLFGGHK